MVKRGFRCLIYLDDLLVLLARNSFAARRVQLLLALLGCFGLTVNTAKSSLVPSTRFEHLGIVVDLKRRQFAAPALKVHRLKAAAL